MTGLSLFVSCFCTVLRNKIVKAFDVSEKGSFK